MQAKKIAASKTGMVLVDGIDEPKVDIQRALVRFRFFFHLNLLLSSEVLYLSTTSSLPAGGGRVNGSSVGAFA